LALPIVEILIVIIVTAQRIIVVRQCLRERISHDETQSALDRSLSELHLHGMINRTSHVESGQADALILRKGAQGLINRALKPGIGLGNFRMIVDIVIKGISQREIPAWGHIEESRQMVSTPRYAGAFGANILRLDVGLLG